MEVRHGVAEKLEIELDRCVDALDCPPDEHQIVEIGLTIGRVELERLTHVHARDEDAVARNPLVCGQS